VNKRKILVPLGDKSYEVTLEAGILNNISEELLKIGITKNKKILVISNEEISNLYGEKFLNNLKDNKFQAKMFLIKAGESYKNLKTLNEIYDVAFEFGLDRNSIIIALGGGIVGDISGFAAATWLRGIEYIQIPTTLLSMVDSSIGGKTAVNSGGGKNLIGTFYQPRLVLSDLTLLKSLSKRNLVCGFAEILKHSIIKDNKFFKKLDKDKNKIFERSDFKTMGEIISKSCKIKLSFVNKDEKEKNDRMILNFGHTFAHGIEAANKYSGKINHGEAVLIGMILATRLSYIKKVCSKKTLDTIENLYLSNKLLKKYLNFLNKKNLNNMQ